MSLFKSTLLALVAPWFVAACGSSKPSMEMDAPIPTEADAICAVNHPCSKVPGPTAEETELCVAIFADTAAACRAENAELFVCSMRAARCTADGDIDDEATYAALEKHCEPARTKLARCCEQAGDEAQVHCEIFRDDEDPVDEAPADAAPAEEPVGSEE
jgi:hypothetical protein